MNDSPYRIVINLEILVNKEIAHIGNRAPFNFWMGFFE